MSGGRNEETSARSPKEGVDDHMRLLFENVGQSGKFSMSEKKRNLVSCNNEKRNRRM